MKVLQKLSQIGYGISQFKQLVVVKDSKNDEKEIKAAFEEVMIKLEIHQAKNPAFFDYLQYRSQIGFNRLQYHIIRDSIAARTQLTIPTVANAISAAAMNDDIKSVAKNGKNLWDEVGKGNPDKVHSKMLLDSFNIHGQIIFDLPVLESLSHSLQSLYLTQELFEYRKMKIKSFSRSYAYIAGNLLAHEYYADDWLVNIKKYVFEPYKGYYQNSEEYDQVMAFFLAHKDDEKEDGNVEEMHGIMAQEAAINACKKDIKKLAEVEKGAMDFANAQSRLWNSLMREIEKASGNPIAPKFI